MPDDKSRARRRAPRAPTTPDPVEIAMEAESHDRSADSPARRLLVKQEALIDAQIGLARHEHLRNRLRLVRDGLLAGLFGLAVLGAGAVVWSASQSRGLVVEGFSTTPEAGQRGLTGEVLAARFLDKLSSIDALAYSTRAPQTLERDWAGDFKVQIPQTGLSAGSAYAELQRLLGHQTRLSGDLIRTGDGVSLSIRLRGRPAVTAAGGEDDVDGLLQAAAERVFAETQAFRYSRYLSVQGRYDEALAVAQKLADEGPAEEKPWAYAQMSLILGSRNLPAALRAAERAVQLKPDLGTAHLAYAAAARQLGLEETTLRHNRQAAAMREPGRTYSPRGAALGLTSAADAAEAEADFAQAFRLGQAVPGDAVTGVSPAGIAGDDARRLARLHDVAGSRRLAREALPEQASMLRHAQAVALEDWPLAVETLQARLATPAEREGPRPSSGGRDPVVNPDVASEPYLVRVQRLRIVEPLLAEALALDGRLEEAERLAARLPIDNEGGLRARGLVAAMAGRPAEADGWFARAIAIGPSIPTTYLAWGRAAAARGDFDRALALYRQAQGKAPRWADPLKLEGDVLLRRHRAADAARRYALAAERAPRWGGLYLAWGDALAGDGKAEEAARKWRQAAALDLTLAERAALASRPARRPG